MKRNMTLIKYKNICNNKSCNVHEVETNCIFSRSFVIMYASCASIGIFLCTLINNTINKFNHQCPTTVSLLSLTL